MYGEDLELTNLIKEEVSQRQKGMCGLCGKKVEEVEASAEKLYLKLQPMNNGGVSDNFLMLCNHCHTEVSSDSPDALESDAKRYAFPHANFSNYSIENVLTDLDKEVASLISMTEDLSRYREAKPKLREAINSIRTLSIPKEDLESRIAPLSEALDKVNKKLSEDNEILEIEFKKNYDILTEKFAETLPQVAESAEFRAGREQLVALQSTLKSLQIRREHRDELQAKLFAAFEDLNRRQQEEWERFEMECIDNFHNLKSKVEEAVSYSETATNFNSAREKLISVQSLFKGLKLKRENREDLFTKIQESFDRLNKRQNEERSVFEAEAETNYSAVKTVVDEAIAFAQNAENFKEAREKLIATQGELKNTKLKREHRDELYAAIRTTFDALNERQSSERESFEKECTENFGKLTTKVGETMNDVENSFDFGLVREKLLAVQSEVKLLKLNRDQRNELFAKIREGFDIFDKRRREHRDRVKEEKSEKLRTIIVNLQNKVDRLNDSIQWDARSLSYQKEKIAQLPETATEDQRKEIQEIIDAIEFRIGDKQKSIDETKSRVEDIQKEIDKL